MASFVIECPKCGRHAQASTIIFLKRGRQIDCACGHVINVRADSMTSRQCAHCGNAVVFNQRRGDSALCPVCAKPVNAASDVRRGNLTDFQCPQCGCGLSADKAAGSFACPVCEASIDVQKELQLARMAKAGLASVIKYEGGNDTFVWKHPVEDFNIGSQLIVHESQEAIFFRDGEALDLFTAGRWPLETASVPKLNNLYNSMLEPSSMFHSEVYFINLTTQMGIKWGTDSRVRFMEPVTGIPLEIGASGEFNLRVRDSRKLVLKLVGTEAALDRSALLSTESGAGETSKPAAGVSASHVMKGYFRSMIMTRVKTHLAKTIKENAINILEIDEHLGALSDALRAQINEGLEEYGLTMPEFFVTNLATPDDDKNFKDLKELHAKQYLEVRAQQVRKSVAEAEAERKAVEARTDAQMRIIDAQGGAEAAKITAQAEADAYRMRAEAEALEMQMKGYTYAQETQRKIGLEAVQGGIIKEGSGGGGMAGAGGLGDVVGLGVTLGAIGGVVGMTKDALAPVMGNAAGLGQVVGGMVNPSGGAQGGSWDCACGAKGIAGNFCSGCGARKPAAQPAAPDAWQCACGQAGNANNFCSNCGAQKPAPWDCACGGKGIIGKFCSNCGAQKAAAWDCACGNKGIAGKFCGNCGKKQDGQGEAGHDA